MDFNSTPTYSIDPNSQYGGFRSMTMPQMSPSMDSGMGALASAGGFDTSQLKGLADILAGAAPKPQKMLGSSGLMKVKGVPAASTKSAAAIDPSTFTQLAAILGG